jgi:AcrR family transcriptional regulator
MTVTMSITCINGVAMTELQVEIRYVGAEERTAAASLRERQGRLARETILDAYVGLLRDHRPEEVTFAQLAGEAGVAERTVYRYFPTRAALYEATGEWIYDTVYGRAPWEDPGTVGNWLGRFPATPRVFERNVHLIRALALSEGGAQVQSRMAGRRRQGVQEAVRQAGLGLPEPELRRAEAMILHLEAAQTWLALYEEAGLSAYDTVAAIDWAVTALLDDLRRRREEAA